jgi:plasmid replication initiation protein
MAKPPFGQLDLFVVSASDVSPKEHQDLMGRCWFSLSKKLRTKPIEHRFGEHWVKITGDAEYGIATIFDNDVLIYVLSHYIDALNQGHQTGRRFHFTGYDFFTFIGKKKFGGKGYTDLWKSLERLHHTFVETNIRLEDGSKRNHSFNWLSEIKQLTDGKAHRGYEIVIPEWLYESALNRKMVLTLDDDYFNIRSGIERFMYLFARKSSGWNTGGWSEGIQSIYEKSGSAGTLNEFKRHLRKLTSKNNLLGYTMESLDFHRQKGIYFERRSELVKLTSEGRERRGAIKWRKKPDGNK